MSHSFEEHTSEVELRLESKTLDGLFVEAAVALAELLADEPPPAGPEIERLKVRAPDRTGLLVAWMNELIFLSEVRKKVFTEFEAVRVTGSEIEATARGGEPKALRTAVKAATFHRAQVTETSGGFRATLVLDV